MPKRPRSAASVEATTASSTEWSDFRGVLRELTSDPTALINPTRREAVRAELNGALKELFDGATAQEPPGVKPLGPLQELYVEVSRRGRRLSVGPLAPGPELEYPALHHRFPNTSQGLDSESIWQQLQIRDKSLKKWARGTTRSLSEAGPFQLVKPRPGGGAHVVEAGDDSAEDDDQDQDEDEDEDEDG